MHQIAYTARLVFAFASKSPLVAQLDRAPGFEPGCREFESLRAGHFRYFACLIDCLVLD